MNRDGEGEKWGGMRILVAFRAQKPNQQKVRGLQSISKGLQAVS